MRFKFHFLALSVATLAGCGRELPPVPEPESRPAKLLTISLSQQQLVREFPATSEAGDKAVLAFRVPGQLQTIPAFASQRVNKGDVLATLNPDEYQQLLKQAQANFKLAEVQYLRFKKLRKDKVVSEQDFDKAAANHKTALASLDQAKANVSYATLRAPYNGTISIVNANNFEFVAAQQGVMNIQTDQILKVVFQMPEHLFRRFTIGDVVSAEMKFDTYHDRSFPLTFQEIDTEADPKTNSYKVTMVMERPDDVGLLPGMSGVVRVEIPEGRVTTIPPTAISDENGSTMVWKRKEDGSVEPVQVELDDSYKIVSGLENGDQIVISGISGLKEGMKVREWIKERGL
ncbi:efflux RND transporter periplasmic adaptor subunit [Vibrio nigripulchritudo]|uniref:efflux RND transporter periplasmic adaptor subunit n=1 Tax=Vibrio nigripulchritudo TaxID=28173 RepID=UPI0003B1D5BE|nr:efflux RND transporter periplasmic adaptor subunit [Vibrio nigripulchritudo]CCN73332.1 putative Secretion protein HlyD [Vibrio nigripulchritudo SFn118]